MRVVLFILVGLISLMPTDAFSDSNSPKIIVLLGPPGSGKGTQAEELHSHYSIPHVSTGDLFRYNIKNETELGKKVKSYIDQGQLVPDSLVLDMLFDRLKQDDCKNGVLLDGTPRTVNQAEAIEAFFQKIPHTLYAVNIQVSDEEVIDRITGRRSCPECGKIYHIKKNPPKKEGVCDRCNVALIQRSDDTKNVVEERLKAYYSQTKPVEEFYQKKGVLYNINGEDAPDKVFEKITKAIS